MAIEYRPRTLMPVAGLGLACFALGAVITGAVSSHYADVKSSDLTRQLTARQARVAMLESALRRQPDTTVSLLAPDVQDPPPEAQPAIPAAAPAVTAPRAKPAPAPAGKPGPAPAPQAVASVPSPAPKPASALRDSLPSPVSAEAIAEARRGNKIYNVDAKDLTERLGIARIEAGALVSRSGVRMPVGSKLPSGERLLYVDPVNQQIMTDQRTLMIF